MRITNAKLFFIGILVVLAALFVGVFYDGNAKANEDNFIFDESIEYPVTHPFPISSTNLPLDTTAQKDKLKSRIGYHDVLHSLFTVFDEEGYKMVGDTTISIGNLTIPVTGYDPIMKVGFLWLDFDRMGEGLLDEKLGQIKNQRQCEIDFLRLLDEGIEIYFDNDTTFIKDVFGEEKETVSELEKEDIRIEWETAMGQLRAGETVWGDVNELFMKYQAAFGQRSTIMDDWKFFGKTLNHDSETVKQYREEVIPQLKSLKTYADKKEYLEIVLRDFRKKLEVEYLSSQPAKSFLDEWKLSASNMIEEPERFFGMVGQIDQLRLYSPSSELLKALEYQVHLIDNQKNRKDWWKHSDAIIKLFSVNKIPGLFNKSNYHKLLADIMNKSKYSKWSKRYDEIHALGEEELLSLKELRILDILAHQQGIFIAPISILDDRVIYDMKEEEYQKKLSDIRSEIANTKNKAERIALNEKLLALSSDRAENYTTIRDEAKAIAKDKLAADMRSYLQWVKEMKEVVSYSDI